jgi:hypothetical protein
MWWKISRGSISLTTEIQVILRLLPVLGNLPEDTECHYYLQTHYCYLPITVRFTKEFRVGEPWKSTRHLYEPASVSRTFSTARCVPAGWSVSVTRKKARPPRACSSAQCVAWSSERPRASRLQSKNKNINSPDVTLQCSMYCYRRFILHTGKCLPFQVLWVLISVINYEHIVFG